MDARSRVAREDQVRAETEDRIITEAVSVEITVADRETAAEEEIMTLYSHQN